MGQCLKKVTLMGGPVNWAGACQAQKGRCKCPNVQGQRAGHGLYAEVGEAAGIAHAAVDARAGGASALLMD